jgi:hypothetical protein
MAKKVKKTEELQKEEKQEIIDGKRGPTISFSKAKADEVRRRLKEDIIQDTSPPPIVIEDTSAPPLIIEGQLQKQRNLPITFRLAPEKIDKLKKMARERAYKDDKDIAYIDIIKEAIDEKLDGSKKSKKQT